MTEIEDNLSDAFRRRRGELRTTHASTTDVRRRARRRTRRRTAVGAGAVAALGVVGVATVVAGGSGNDAHQLAVGSGDGGDGDVGAASNGGLWRCTDPVTGGFTAFPTSTLPRPDNTTAPGEVTAGTTIVLPSFGSTTIDPGTSGSTTIAPADVAATTTLASGGSAATSTSMATSTTIVIDQTASSTSIAVSADVSGEYYFQHCEQFGTPDPSSPATISGDTNAVDTISPPNMEVEASAAPSTSSGRIFDPNDAVTCLSRGADFFVLTPTCWKMAVDTGTTDTFMQSLKTYVESTLVGYRLTAVGDSDTIVSIAGKFNITPDALVAANGGDANMMLTLYQPLLVPPSA